MTERRYCYDWPRAMVTVDNVLLRVRRRALEVLLVRRKRPPYKGRWALPGGFIEMTESLEQSALRELHEETGIQKVAFFKQVGAYGDPSRDPRGRTISVAFVALARDGQDECQAGDDAADAAWYPVKSLPLPLAFDHETIIADALAVRLRKSPKRK